jgi:ribonuclease D
MASAKRIGYDTEFVSEYTYFPDLCLIQVAVDGHLAVIDPKAVDDITIFWETLASGDHQTIVHAGREEFLFCYRAIGRWPKHWFDVQLAAGMTGLDFPASYRNLIRHLLNKSLPKGETRTDWRKRPLTAAQLEYAVHDVVDLDALFNKLTEQLRNKNRLAWLHTENEERLKSLRDAETSDRTPRLSGYHSLSGKSARIAFGLWEWRDRIAREKNTLPKRILRDDLLIELARRGQDSVRSIRAIRGMHHRDVAKLIPEISDAIRLAANRPEISRPHRPRVELPAQLQLLTQFLNTALACTCRAQHITPALVGTVQDVQDLIIYELKLDPQPEVELPSLKTGWREEVVGDLLEKLLLGRVSLRIVDPLSDRPLSFSEE